MSNKTHETFLDKNISSFVNQKQEGMPSKGDLKNNNKDSRVTQFGSTSTDQKTHLGKVATWCTNQDRNKSFGAHWNLNGLHQVEVGYNKGNFCRYM